MVKLKEKEIYKKILKIILVVAYIFVGALGFPNHNDITTFKELMVSYYLIAVIFVFLIVFFSSHSLARGIKSFFAKLIRNIWATFKYFFLIVIIFLVIRAITSVFLSAVPSGNNLIIETLKVYPFYVFFVTVLYVPFVEGIIFRKYLHDLVNNKYLFMLISSIFYGYLHVMGDYSNIIEFVALFMPIWAIGLGLAYSYVKTKNIYVSILCHFLYNLFVYITLVV